MAARSQLSILIVEDEIVLAHTMREMLHELGYVKIRIANTYTRAQAAFQSGSVDFAILDINLGEGNEGLKLAKACHVRDIPFFYVTSYTDKPTLDRALETAPGAYLIKPFLQSNLYTAVQITLNGKKGNGAEKFSFKDGTEVVTLNCNEVLYLQADNVYVKIVTNSKTYLYRSSLHGVMGLLPSGKFIQTHRSFVVNRDFLTRVKSEMVELGEIEVPLSRSYKKAVQSLFPVEK